MPPLDSDLLRSFLTVCAAGSLTAAAGRVGRTQSAISMQIARLEEVLGTRLFQRRPRGMAPTEAGKALQLHATRIIEMLDAAASAVRDRNLGGPVRIGFPPEYCESALPRILARFGEQHPAVEVGIRCDYSQPLLAALDAGSLDIAIVYDRAEAARGEVLRVEPTLWVTSDRHDQHLRRPLPVAAYFNSKWCRESMIPSLERSGMAYRIAFECDTTQGFLSAVRSGLAVVALSRNAIPEGCRALTESDGFPAVDLASLVLRRGTQGHSPAIDALADLIGREFRRSGQ